MNWWKELRAAHYLDVLLPGYDEEGNPIKPPGNFWLWLPGALWWNFTQFFLSLICRVKGHRIELVSSWAGPESGGEEFSCSRCGESFGVTYY